MCAGDLGARRTSQANILLLFALEDGDEAVDKSWLLFGLELLRREQLYHRSATRAPNWD